MAQLKKIEPWVLKKIDTLGRRNSTKDLGHVTTAHKTEHDHHHDVKKWECYTLKLNRNHFRSVIGSNLGQLLEKRERYLCALPSHLSPS